MGTNVPKFDELKGEASRIKREVWDLMDNDTKRRWVNAFDKNTSNSNDSGNKAVKATLETELALSSQILQKYRAIGDAETRNHAILELGIEMMKAEQEIREDVVKEMGLIGPIQMRTTNEIMKAQGEARKYGVEFRATQQAALSISEEFGRGAMTWSSDDLAQAAIFADSVNMSTDNLATMVKRFNELGLGMGAAIDKGQEMTNIARDMGVNMDAFMDNINANMDMLNTYNFADGVEGFARMAAQSAKIGLSMANVSRIAEDVMDPEGAIELATKLQVIGGAVGDLADPFKLMYMATNDLEGLGKAIANVGGDLAVFNEETHQLEFPPTAQRQLRELADATGIAKEELASMIKTQKMFEMMQNQMDLSAFETAGITEFVTSMATMGEDGRFEIEIGGQQKFLDEIDVGSRDFEALIELQKESTDNAKLTEKDVALQSRNLLQSINDNMVGADRSLQAGLLKGTTLQETQIGLQETVSGALPSEMVYASADKIAGLAGDSVAGIMGTEMKNVTTMVETIGDGFKAGGITFGQMAVDVLGKLKEMSTDNLYATNVNIVNGKKENDFSVPMGETQALLTDSGVIIPSSKDVVSGIAVNAETKGADLGSISTNNNKMPEVLVKFGGNIPLTIDGKNMGKMSSNEIWNLITKNPVLLHQIKMELAGITNDSPLPGQQQIRHMEV